MEVLYWKRWECILFGTGWCTTDVSRAVAKPVVWSKLLNHTKNRTPGHMLSNNGLYLHSMHSTICSTGGKLWPVWSYTLTLATRLYVLLMSIHKPIHICSTTTKLYIVTLSICILLPKYIMCSVYSDLPVCRLPAAPHTPYWWQLHVSWSC